MKRSRSKKKWPTEMTKPGRSPTGYAAIQTVIFKRTYDQSTGTIGQIFHDLPVFEGKKFRGVRKLVIIPPLAGTFINLNHCHQLETLRIDCDPVYDLETVVEELKTTRHLKHPPSFPYHWQMCDDADCAYMTIKQSSIIIRRHL